MFDLYAIIRLSFKRYSGRQDLTQTHPSIIIKAFSVL